MLEAIQYARSLAPERLIAVSVVTDHDEQERLVQDWADHEIPVPLHTIASPYREITRPVLEYLDELDAESPDDVITVIIPEFVTDWKQQWLHNQTALALKARLLRSEHRAQCRSDSALYPVRGNIVIAGAVLQQYSDQGEQRETIRPRRKDPGRRLFRDRYQRLAHKNGSWECQ